MKITYKNVHNRFKLNGVHFSKDDLCRIAFSYIKDGEEYQHHIGQFLLDWFDENDYVTVKTSGTTGKPKQIEISKEAMVNSALATGDFFKLQPGNTALLCMSAQYIAGKMMLVRALILGLELDVVAPSSSPLVNCNTKYDFVAMVPMQVENSLPSLNLVKTIIIGGAKLNYSLKENLKSVSTAVFETYGMTETITHIAAKSIHDDFFTVLPNVQIQQDDRNCLIVNAPKISKEEIVTNDVVDVLSNTTFKWLGRFDNVINSGGVKLFPEEIEEKLQNKIEQRFFVTSKEDDVLGQKVVLIVESEEEFVLDSSVFQDLEKFEKPKQIFFTDKFIETETNKINRIKTVLKIGVV